MDRELITRNIALTGGDKEKKRSEILDYFLKTYEIYEKLYDCFVDETVFYTQPEPLRHQLVFYYGHTASFYINKLIIGKHITQRVNPDLENMFAIGVDEMSWDDLNKEHYNWPTVKETKEYRDKVKNVVGEYIQTTEFDLPIDWNSPMWVILMGIEHERIHLETSSVLHRQLDIKYIKEDPFWSECEEFSNHPKNSLIEVSGKEVVLGKRQDSEYYGWDNEYGEYRERVEDFKASKYLVSNGEYLEFVKDGGYLNSSFWSSEGLSWKEYQKAEFPTFWIKDGDSFKYRTMTRIIDMPHNWPVDVNFLEAEAFCSWKSKKLGKNITLPSEAMWHRLADYCQVLDEKDWENLAPGNINLEHFSSSCPVDKFGFGEFYDVIGNVWQWTTTPISGFSGFKVHPLYDDFSVPTFDTRHNIIKGGSWISTGNEVLKESRYAFRRHFYQHAGFRYVETDKGVDSNRKQVEKDQEILEECRNHYGENYQDLKSRNEIITSKILKYLSNRESALELGCSVGRTVFQLSQFFESVVGIDFSTRFIKEGQSLIDNKTIEFDGKKYSLEDLDIRSKDLKKVEFWQGDSCNLKPHFAGYDLILISLDQESVYNLEKLLSDIPTRLNKDGILIINKEYSKEKILEKNLLLLEKNSLEVWKKK